MLRHPNIIEVPTAPVSLLLLWSSTCAWLNHGACCPNSNNHPWLLALTLTRLSVFAFSSFRQRFAWGTRPCSSLNLSRAASKTLVSHHPLEC